MIAEIIYLGSVATITLVFLYKLNKLNGNPNVKKTVHNFQERRKNNKLKKLEKGQKTTEETIEDLTNKIQDLHIALKLKPDDKKEGDPKE